MATGTGTPVLATSTIATATDLVTYGYSADASGFLARAAARVKGYARQEIVPTTDTVSLRSPFLLPGRPVTSVITVTWVDDIGVETEDVQTHTLTVDEDYRLEGQRIICPGYKDKLLTVTYEYGFAAFPAELVELVCGIAARMHAAPRGLVAGYQSESADGESIAYGSDAFAGVTELTSAEKRVIDRIFPHTRKVPGRAETL